MFSTIKSVAGCTALAAMGLGLASQVHAQEDWGFHPYGGANYGFHKSGDGDYDEDRDLWEVYGGVGFNRWFGAEVNYANLGNMSNESVDVDIKGWGIAAVGQLPITDSFSLYAKLGQFFYDAELDIDLGDPDETSWDTDGDEPFFTVGAGFNITDPLTVTLEYTRYNADFDLEELEGFNEIVDDSDSGDLDTAKIGVRFMF